jgi:hypothetical protein
LQTWGLPQLVEVARRIVTELVANAVEPVACSSSTRARPSLGQRTRARRERVWAELRADGEQ